MANKLDKIIFNAVKENGIQDGEYLFLRKGDKSSLIVNRSELNFNQIANIYLAVREYQKASNSFLMIRKNGNDIHYTFSPSKINPYYPLPVIRRAE